MPGRVKNGRSPKICYEDETCHPVPTGSLCCSGHPLQLDHQQRSSEGKLRSVAAPSADGSAAAGPLLKDNFEFSNDKHCSGSALAERLSHVGLANTCSPLATRDQAEHTRCSETVLRETHKIGDFNCCQETTSEIRDDEGPKLRNDRHNRVCVEHKTDSPVSLTVEAVAISTQRNNKSPNELNSPPNAASVLLDTSARHLISAALSARTTAESICSSSAALSSCQPTTSDDFTDDFSSGASSGSAPGHSGTTPGHSGTTSSNAASVSSGVQDLSVVEHPEKAASPEQELREACGVFGFVLAKGEEPPPTFSLARTIMDGLVALQHRGQESAGIVTSDGRGCQAFNHHRGLGLVSSVFSPEKLAPLKGILGLGHTRYSTAGGSDLSNVQPFMVHTRHGQLAIAHNGELINADTLRKTVLERGVGLSTRSDSELITQILSLTPLRGEHHGGADWRARIRHLMEATPTSYSLAIMNEDKIYAVRDPFGNRPLCVGLLRELDEEGISLAGGESSRVLGYVLSSESCAFTSVGATFMREVMPGEIIELSPGGVRRIDLVFRPQTCRPLSLLEDVSSTGQEEGKSLQLINGSSNITSGTNGSLPFLHDIENVPPAFCIFEYVYFARPDSYFESQQVYTVRQRSGRQLALEAPVEVDIVSCVPESATPAAMGFAMQLNLPYVEVLHKSRYVGRTFIQPCVTSRKRSVAHKFAAIAENVRGKRVVLVDDSVVRGTTIRPIVKLIRDAGAKEVHFRVASPPIRHPCYMGINIPTREELVANRMPLEQLAEYFCVDSLQYLSLEGLVASVREGAKSMPGETVGHCTACLSGRYPVKKEY